MKTFIFAIFSLVIVGCSSTNENTQLDNNDWNPINSPQIIEIVSDNIQKVK